MDNFSFAVTSLALFNYVLAYVILGIVLLVISVFVLRKNPGHPLNQIFSAYSFSIAFWSLLTIPLITSTDPRLAYRFDQLCLAGAIFIPATFFHFVLVFLRQAKRYLLLILIFYSISLVFLFFDFLGILIPAVAERPPFNFYTVPGPAYTLFVTYFTLLSTAGVILLFGCVIRGGILRPRYLKQVKWLAAASLLGYLGGGTNFLLVYGIEIPFVTPVANYAILLYGIAVAYIILKYRFLEIELIVKKTIAFAGLFSVVMVVVGIVTGVTQSYLGQKLQIRPEVTPVLSVLFAMLLYDPTRRFLTGLTDRFLFQRKEDIRGILKRLSENIVTILDLDQVAGMILKTFEDTLRAETGVILLKNTEGYEWVNSYGLDWRVPKPIYPPTDPLIRHLENQPGALYLETEESASRLPLLVTAGLERLKALLAIPLRLHGELIGVLTLGKKKSDQEY